MHMRFQVPDMSCSACVRHINAAVTSLDPQAKVEVDLDTHSVSITTTASQPDIEKALAAAGYPARPV